MPAWLVSCSSPDVEGSLSTELILLQVLSRKEQEQDGPIEWLYSCYICRRSHPAGSVVFFLVQMSLFEGGSSTPLQD